MSNSGLLNNISCFLVRVRQGLIRRPLFSCPKSGIVVYNRYKYSTLRFREGAMRTLILPPLARAGNVLFPRLPHRMGWINSLLEGYQTSAQIQVEL